MLPISTVTSASEELRNPVPERTRAEVPPWDRLRGTAWQPAPAEHWKTGTVVWEPLGRLVINCAAATPLAFWLAENRPGAVGLVITGVVTVPDAPVMVTATKPVFNDCGISALICNGPT